MLHTVLARSLPNGHGGKEMLFLLTMASGTPANNFVANSAASGALMPRIGMARIAEGSSGPFPCQIRGRAAAASKFAKNADRRAQTVWAGSARPSYRRG
jgi:hypothetical protein